MQQNVGWCWQDGTRRREQARASPPCSRDGNLGVVCGRGRNVLHIDKLGADAPEGVENLVLDLYSRMPHARITDLLLEVDAQRVAQTATVYLPTGKTGTFLLRKAVA